MKKRIFRGILFIILVGLTITVCAAVDGYISTLSISFNSTLVGSSRKYKYNNHKIQINDVTVNYGDTNTGLVIALYKDGLLSGTLYKRKLVTIKNGNNSEILMGNAGSGKRYYAFGTYQNALKDGDSGHGEQYSGLVSNSVLMKSYE